MTDRRDTPSAKTARGKAPRRLYVIVLSDGAWITRLHLADARKALPNYPGAQIVTYVPERASSAWSRYGVRGG